MTNRLPVKDVVTLAKAEIGEQEMVPESPAVLAADGRIELCTAAAIAYAGYSLSVSPARARSFAKEAAESKSKELIADAFGELGWSRDWAHSVLSDNDKVPGPVRKAWSIAFLSELAERCPTSACS